MKTSLITISLLSTLTSLALAISDPYAWSPALAGYYDAVAQHIQSARSSDTFPTPPSCDLSKATLPVAPTPLPSPSGLTLVHVAVGRGVQNYTCANSTSSATPLAVGAVANLYNASCLAVNYPDLLAMIPNIALQRPTPPKPAPALAPSDIQLSGHHYFSTNTTPVFRLDSATDAASHMGMVVGKKAANSTAPAGSAMGAGGKGYGSVAWLYLTATNASEVVNIAGDGTVNLVVGKDEDGLEWKAVYRLNTAGGSPPKTCEDVKMGKDGGAFSVDYASVYYFFKG